MSFGERLKTALARKRLSQDELAHHLGISQASVSLYVKDSGRPKENRIEEIAKILEVDYLWLSYGTDEYDPNVNLFKKIEDLKNENLELKNKNLELEKLNDDLQKEMLDVKKEMVEVKKENQLLQKNLIDKEKLVDVTYQLLEEYKQKLSQKK